MKQSLTFLSLVLLLSFPRLYAQDFWEVVNIPPDKFIYSIGVSPSSIIYIGLSPSTGGGILKSVDGGENWIPSGLQNMAILSIITPDNIIYAASGSIFRSINDGEDWESISPAFGPISLFVTSDDILFAGIWGGIYKSDPIGSNWVQVLSLENFEVVNSIIEDTVTGVLYAGTINFIMGGGVYRSIDDGDTWNHIGLTDHYVSSLSMNSSGDLLAGARGHNYLSTGGVYMLPNGQTEWICKNNMELVTSLVINTNDEIYIGCSNLDGYPGGTRFSMDNGQTWENISTGMGNQDLEKLVIGPEGHLYAVAYNSLTPLFKSVNSTINSINHIHIEKDICAYNCPNPFIDETTLHLSLPLLHQSEVVLSIYNSFGEKIDEMIVKDYSGKEHSVKYNSTKLSAGIYFYRISAGSTEISGKMIKWR